VSARFPHLAGDLRGGFASALVGLPYAVTSAMIAFAPLGPSYTAAAMVAGALTSLVAGLITAAIGGTACQINGPRASEAVLMASIVAIAAAHPALRGPDGVDPGRVLGVVMLCLMVAGGLQVLFGALRMGSMVRVLPYPVISGFMVGLGILVAGPQIPTILGLDDAHSWRAVFGGRGIGAGSLLVGVVTIAVIVAVRRFRPKLPAPLLGILAGALLHYALASFTRVSVGPTGWDTLTQGRLPPMPWELPRFAFDTATAEVIVDLLPAAATLAFVAALESLLSSSVVSIVSNMRYSSRRELIGQGVSNIAVAAVGGVASSGAPFRGVVNFGAGGRTRLSGAAHAVIVGALGIPGAGLLFLVPLAAWAAVLVVVGWDVASAWARRLAANPREDIGVGLIVGVVTLALGTVPAMIVGIIGSVLLYVERTSRAPIRGHYDGTERSSRRVRPEAQLAHLRDLGPERRVVELQGALFFGTADRCGREIEKLAQGARHFIVDLRRVGEVDTTGALVLMQTLRRVSEGGARVALASVAPGGRRGKVLSLAGVPKIVPESLWYADADNALEAAEAEEIAKRWPAEASRELGIAEMDLAAGMSAEEIDALVGYLERRACGNGAVLFREGEPGDSLYLIAQGIVTVRIDVRPSEEKSRRIAAYGPGLVVGEIAVFEGAARTASAVCEGETVLHVLGRAALERMAREAPALHGKLLMSLARQMAARLRRTTLELRRALD
jgi:SulP family sulfate permease